MPLYTVVRKSALPSVEVRADFAYVDNGYVLFGDYTDRHANSDVRSTTVVALYSDVQEVTVKAD